MTLDLHKTPIETVLCYWHGCYSYKSEQRARVLGYKPSNVYSTEGEQLWLKPYRCLTEYAVA